MNDRDTGQALPRRERERLAHRQEILEAAERVFARRGFHGATVEEIAREAEFAVGTLYNFFTSKEDLYTEVVGKLAEEFMGMFRERVASEADPATAIATLIEVRLTMFERHRGFARVFFETMMGAHADLAQALPKRCAPLYDEGMAVVTGIFERGVRQGVFVDADPLFLALSLHGVLNAFIAYWTRRDAAANAAFADSLAERAGEVKAVFLDRIVRREG